MATYKNLNENRNDQTLQERCAIAVCVAAYAVMTESDQTANHSARMAWAAAAIASPEAQGQRALYLFLAQYKDETIPNIKSKTDAELQTSVNAMVNLLAT